MEDVVAEAESLLHPINLSGDEVIEERQNPEAAKQEGGDRAGGFINHLISNLVTGGDADEEKQDEQADKETIPEDKGGGILDHMISNLVTPSSPQAGNITQGKVEAFDVRSENESGFRSEEEVGGGGRGGGGLINNIVSNLFHHSEGEVRESPDENKKEEMVKVGEETKAEKTEGGGGGGGGIIENIVSHLPISLPDDAAPTSDEATILIHIAQD
ncbi:hypothetical protein QUC31_011526 [Theobroma cacao]|nr:hypothetical protein QQP08_017927 [Theobroma cacao]